jgi:hypothetical protein
VPAHGCGWNHTQIDRQEALIKAENRRLQIERANKMLYDETDRVKTFHSALMMSDVMQERENQIRYKAKLKQVVQRQDDEFHRNQMEALAVSSVVCLQLASAPQAGPGFASAVRWGLMGAWLDPR